MIGGQVGKAAVPAVSILGVPVSRVDMAAAVATIGRWIETRASAFVCALDVHSLMRAQDDAEHMAALRGAAMVTPDGQPVVWAARARGTGDMSRVCGPDLLPQVCAASVARGWKHYFYGGADGVASDLAERLQAKHPGLAVVGTDCPPFRALSTAEQEAALARIRASGAQILWVGLGCPKQEKWMLANRDKLPGVVMIGIGAAFDFHVDRVRRAPRWMREGGLEWLHRLMSEPRRLWRRYLVMAPRFVVASLAETASIRLRPAR